MWSTLPYSRPQYSYCAIWYTGAGLQWTHGQATSRIRCVLAIWKRSQVLPQGGGGGTLVSGILQPVMDIHTTN